MISEQFVLNTSDGRAALREQFDLPEGSLDFFPGVIFVSGSGPQDRDGYFGDSRTERDLVYRELGKAFVAAGFAVVRWDYRGVSGNELTMPGATRVRPSMIGRSCILRPASIAEFELG